MKKKICLFFHKWERQDLLKGQAKRGVTGYRICKKCGQRQIRKSLYRDWINRNGWVNL